jgi:hypothetical protein
MDTIELLEEEIVSVADLQKLDSEDSAEGGNAITVTTCEPFNAWITCTGTW